MVVAAQEERSVASRSPLTVPTPDYALGNDWGNGEPDPTALTVAKALQELWADHCLVVFGSRATGIWQPGSDLDLAVIGGAEGGHATSSRLSEEAKVHLRACGITGYPYIQIHAFTQAEFDEARASLPHLAGQAQRHGILPTGEPMPPIPQNNPWPGVQARLRNTRYHLQSAVKALGTEAHDNAVRHSHTALENVIKGALGMLGVDTVIDSEGKVVNAASTHDLAALARGMPAERQSWLAGLPEIHIQEELTQFRLLADYSGDMLPWPSAPVPRIVADAQYVCGNLAGILLESLGKTSGDVGYADRLGEGSLGGWESVSLDYFEPDIVSERELAAAHAAGEVAGEARGEERGEERGEARGVAIGRDLERAAAWRELQAERLETARTLIPLLLEHALPAEDRQALMTHWQARGTPADYLDRLQEVQAAPAQWRRICDCPDDADTREPPPLPDG